MMFRELDRLPLQRELHHWADYLEVRCLASSDGVYAYGEAHEAIERGRDIGQAEEDSVDDGLGLGPDFVLDLLEQIEEVDGADADRPTAGGLAPAVTWSDDDPDRTDDDDDAASQRENFGVRLADIARHLEYRSEAFADHYPFQVRDHGLERKGELTARQRLYVYFLLCASQRYVDKGAHATLRTSFEVVCSAAFRCCVPGSAEVDVFGTTGGSAGSAFTGNLWKKVSDLAAALRLKLLVEEQEFAPTDSGDNGLDLVAWLPMPDRSKGFPIAFAQCATGASNWKEKQHEAGEHHWGETIHFSSPLQSFTFIPFCYHDPSGDWSTPHHVIRGVLVDRLRHLYLLDQSTIEVADLGLPGELLEQALSTHEP